MIAGLVGAARLELRMLLEDYESKSKRLEEIMDMINTLMEQILEAKKLLEIKGSFLY